MQKLMSIMRSAIDDYNMIEENDVIAVGVSGGKDSISLLCGLNGLSKFYPKSFKIKAITIDPCFNNEPGDFESIRRYCLDNDIEYTVKQTELYHIIFETRKEKNPCSLCSRMRRGLLHDAAVENGCNKIALGHNKDDVCETFMMNLLSGGTISCFSPVSYLSRKNLYMIRPLIYAEESDTIAAVNRLSLPVVESSCPVNEKTDREKMKKLICELDKEYPALESKIINALQKAHISNW